MQLVRSLLLAHASLTFLLALLLLCVVAAQGLRDRLRSRAGTELSTSAPQSGSELRSGASVLEWAVDLRGVGQREDVLRT